jgi:hypothetical protein
MKAIRMWQTHFWFRATAEAKKSINGEVFHRLDEIRGMWQGEELMAAHFLDGVTKQEYTVLVDFRTYHIAILKVSRAEFRTMSWDELRQHCERAIQEQKENYK